MDALENLGPSSKLSGGPRPWAQAPAEGYIERELANAREHDARYKTWEQLTDSDPDRPF